MFAGSVVGAVALHVAMVACGGGAQPTGDGGVFDALADAARDVLDAETRDAHAGGDGGVPACNCVEPPSFTFSGGALARDGQPPQEPAADFSTVVASASLVRSADGTPVVNLNATVIYHLADGGRVTLSCTVIARPDGSVVMRPPARTGGAAFDTECTAVGYQGAPGSDVRGSAADGAPQVTATGARLASLTGDAFALQLPALPMRFQRPGEGGSQVVVGAGSVAPITVRARVPGAAWLTPPRAYRP